MSEWFQRKFFQKVLLLSESDNLQDEVAIFIGGIDLLLFNGRHLILLHFCLCNLKRVFKKISSFVRNSWKLSSHKIHWSVNYAISCHIISDCCHFWQRTKRFCFLLNFFMGTLCHSFCDWGHSLGLLISMEEVVLSIFSMNLWSLFVLAGIFMAFKQ